MRRVTIEDVAREAGVSRQTVSRAINAKAEISPATRDRVLEVVERLGYRPNRLAQGMVTQRTRTVGLLVADITNPFVAEVFRGAQAEAREYGYNLFLANSDENAEIEMEALSTLVTQGVDGLIALSLTADDAFVLDFVETFRPLVLINRHLDHPDIGVIWIDLERAAGLATDYLIEKGHRKIGMLATPSARENSTRRVIGFREALERHGLRFDGSRIARDRPTLGGGYAATHDLLARHPDTSAIFAYNDLMAVGAMRVCHELGRAVPDDCAIIGFDDIPLASMVTPALSTIRYDTHALGRRAMHLVLQMIEHPEQNFPPVELEFELVRRGSSGN